MERLPLYIEFLNIFINNLHESKTLIIEGIIIDFVCRLMYPVNNFSDISFSLVVYWGNAFWATGEFLLQYNK